MDLLGNIVLRTGRKKWVKEKILSHFICFTSLASFFPLRYLSADVWDSVDYYD